MIRLNKAELEEAKWIFKDLLRNPNQRWPKSATDGLYNFIVTRSFDGLVQPFSNYANIDEFLQRYGDRLRSPKSGRRIHRDADTIARYIAYFCQELGLQWDTSLKTQFEMNEYLSTALGKALNEAGCFGTAPKQTVSATNQSAQTANQTAAKAKTAPASSYKAAGPQSGNVVGLIGTPGQKIYLSGILFGIEADKLGANTPHAFIHPVENAAAGERARLDSTSHLPVILFGSGNGYTDCTVFFVNAAEADNVLQQLKNNYTKYSNMRVVKVSASSSGYYKVNTALGEVFIKAVKLNETLEEATDTATIAEDTAKLADRISDIDTYDTWSRISIS